MLGVVDLRGLAALFAARHPSPGERGNAAAQAVLNGDFGPSHR